MAAVRAVALSLLLMAATVSGLQTGAMTLARDYFLLRGARITVAFLCSDLDRIAFVKTLSAVGVWALATDEHRAEYAVGAPAVQRYYKTGMFIDFTCPQGRTAFERSTALQLLDAGRPCLVWGGAPGGGSAVGRLRLDSDVAWAPGAALQWPPESDRLRTSRDLKGARLRAAFVLPQNGIDIFKISTHYLAHPWNTRGVLNLYHYRTFILLSEWFNFTFTIIPASHSNEDKKYEDVVRMIAEKEVDVSISAVLPDRRRLEQVLYLPTSISALRMKAVFRHPPLTEFNWALLKPFTVQLWAAATLLWLLIAVFLRMLSKAQAWAMRDHPDDAGESHSSSDVMLLIAGTLGEQGSDLDSKWVTWRLVFSTMLMLTVLLNNYYDACMVSWLLSETPRTISDLEKLVHSPLHFGCENITHVMPYFVTNEDPLMRELYAKKMRSRKGEEGAGFYSLQVGVRKMLEEDFAFHADANVVYGLIEATFPEHERCDLTEIQLLRPRSHHLALPSHSPYKELFSYGLGRMKESGVMDYMWQHSRPRRTSCLSLPRVRSMKLSYTAPAFVILLVGALLSLIPFTAELLWHHRENRSVTKIELITEKIDQKMIEYKPYVE